MTGEANGQATAAQDPGKRSCPLGVPAVMCINYEVTGWGCAECTVSPAGKEGTDA